MKRIRVLEIISGFAVEGPLGGIERFGIELALALEKTHIEPIVCGMWAYGTPYEYGWVEKLNRQGVRAFVAAEWNAGAPRSSFRQAYLGVQREISNEVEIIHSHCQFGDVLALLLRRPLGAKALVRTVHNEREWGKRLFRRLLLTGFLYPLKFDQEIGVAQQVVDNLNSRVVARLVRKPSIRFYNSLNLERFGAVEIDRVKKKAQLGIPANAPVIGTVGRLTEQKGYGFFLKAAAIVLQQLPDSYFLIVGSGNLESTLRYQAQKMALDRRVIFTGPRADIEELYAVMDVFVNSSLWEGLPTVLLESMAARVPIVATSVSGNKELIEHGLTGLLVPPADFDSLAHAILDTLRAPSSIIEERQKRAYDFVGKNFSIASVAKQHQSMYNKVVAKP